VETVRTHYKRRTAGSRINLP